MELYIQIIFQVILFGIMGFAGAWLLDTTSIKTTWARMAFLASFFVLLVLLWYYFIAAAIQLIYQKAIVT